MLRLISRLHVHVRLLVLLISAVSISCKNGVPIESVKPTGVLAGHVYLFNFSGQSLPTGGAEITISGKAFKTLSNYKGEWFIDSLPIGNYEVVATKEGYGTMRWYNQQITGPGTLYVPPVTIFPTPTCTITLTSVKYEAGGVRIYGDAEGTDSVAGANLDLDFDSITPPGAPHALHSPISMELLSDGPWDMLLEPRQFKELASHTRVFASCYSIYGAGFDFTDPLTGQTLPVSPGPKSNALPITIP